MNFKINFNLNFTTSKLLAYIVVLLSAILGYLLTSTEVVIVGFTIGSTLSGVKSILNSKKPFPSSNNETNSEINDENKN